MQGDTCPTVIPWICMCIKQVLIGWKLIFGYNVQWQQMCTVEQFSTNQTPGDILYPGFWLVKNCSLCHVPAATGPCIQNSTFNQSELVKGMRNFAEWPLDMYHSVGHVTPFTVWNSCLVLCKHQFSGVTFCTQFVHNLTVLKVCAELHVWEKMNGIKCSCYCIYLVLFFFSSKNERKNYYKSIFTYTIM